MDRVTAQKQGTEVGIVAYLGGFRRDAQNGACSRIHSTSNDLNEEFIIEHVGNRLEGDRTTMFSLCPYATGLKLSPIQGLSVTDF